MVKILACIQSFVRETAMYIIPEFRTPTFATEILYFGIYTELY